MNQKQLQQLIRYCIGFKVVFTYKRVDFWYRTFGICGQYISDTDLSQNKLEKEMIRSFQIFNEYVKKEKLEKEILHTEYQQYFLLTEIIIKH